MSADQAAAVEEYRRQLREHHDHSELVWCSDYGCGDIRALVNAIDAAVAAAVAAENQRCVAIAESFKLPAPTGVDTRNIWTHDTAVRIAAAIARTLDPTRPAPGSQKEKKSTCPPHAYPWPGHPGSRCVYCGHVYAPEPAPGRRA